MAILVSGFALLAVSLALELGPQLFSESWQYGLKISCILGAIWILFRQRPVQLTESKFRDASVGLSVLIPIAVTWLIYNHALVIPLGIDPDGLYSFLLWGVFIIASIPVWGQILLGIGVISRDERESFRTWRVALQRPITMR